MKKNENPFADPPGLVIEEPPRSPIKRELTGIPGLDILLEGGFPSGSSIVVEGGPGTGKTTLAMQYIANGAEKYGRKGVFITVVDTKEKLYHQFLSFGMDLRKLEKEGKIMILAPEVRTEEGEDIINLLTSQDFIMQLIDFNAERLAMDSLNMIMEYSMGVGGARRSMERLFNAMSSIGMTTIYTYEKYNTSFEEEYEMQDFIADGLIRLELIKSHGVLQRALTIIKMKKTAHGRGIYPFKIEKEGIHVYHDQQVF